MERSAIQVMVTRGKSQRQIAKELGRSRTTIARVLQEPVEQSPTKRRRRSKVESFRTQIDQGIGEGLSNTRILELARADAVQPYRGGRTVFGEFVRRMRQEFAQQQAARDVPMRFEGLPAE